MPLCRRAAVAVVCLAAVLVPCLADAAELPNSLAAVRAGQWVEYRHRTVFGVAEQKQTVASVEGDGDERVITIDSVMSIEGEVVDERTDAVTYRQALEEQQAALDDADGMEIAPASMDAAGRQVDGVRLTFVQDGVQVTVYLSESIPLSGVARMEMEGAPEPVMELIGFGEQGEE